MASSCPNFGLGAFPWDLKSYLKTLKYTITAYFCISENSSSIQKSSYVCQLNVTYAYQNNHLCQISTQLKNFTYVEIPLNVMCCALVYVCVLYVEQIVSKTKD